MRHHGARFGVLVFTVCGTLVLTGGAPLTAAVSLVKVEGAVASIEGNRLTIATNAGEPTRVDLSAKTCVVVSRPAGLEDITTGDFIGVASRKAADGALTAVFINIFSPELSGCIPAGQRLMQSGNTMTNAIVATVMSSSAGRKLSLAYKGGTVTIRVPQGTAVHRLMLVPRASLKPGMRVLVRGTRTANASVTASVILVE